jgi:hypothetical protein
MSGSFFPRAMKECVRDVYRSLDPDNPGSGNAMSSRLSMYSLKAQVYTRPPRTSNRLYAKLHRKQPLARFPSRLRIGQCKALGELLRVAEGAHLPHGNRRCRWIGRQRGGLRDRARHAAESKRESYGTQPTARAFCERADIPDSSLGDTPATIGLVQPVRSRGGFARRQCACDPSDLVLINSVHRRLLAPSMHARPCDLRSAGYRLLCARLQGGHENPQKRAVSAGAQRRHCVGLHLSQPPKPA